MCNLKTVQHVAPSLNCTVTSINSPHILKAEAIHLKLLLSFCQWMTLKVFSAKTHVKVMRLSHSGLFIYLLGRLNLPPQKQERQGVREPIFAALNFRVLLRPD